MTQDKTGGPAFPIKGRGAFDLELVQAEGMTLRDWFAGQVISSVKGWHPADKRGRSSAVIAYEIADDMIKARGNK